MSEDKITTLDELLKKIEQSQKHGCADDWTPEGQGYNNGLKRAIELIYKFDEGTRSKLDELRRKIEARRDYLKDRCIDDKTMGRYQEILRVLSLFDEHFSAEKGSKGAKA